MSRPVSVLVVDDSALVRRTVSRLLAEDPSITVAGTAADGRAALDEAARLSPDVVTLDIDMPVMDGLTCLAELVRRRQRVVILSTLAEENAFTTWKALAIGAVDFVTKPGADRYLGSLEALGTALRSAVATAARVPASRIGRRRAPAPEAPVPAPPAQEPRPQAPLLRLIGVGGSTGGASALETLLRGLPADLPAALVAVQHMPPGFSASFARYLSTVSRLAVREGREGEVVEPRSAYLAPGEAHLRIQKTARGFVLRVDPEGPPNHGYRPSIDLLLYSMAAAGRDRTIGVLLSGMGDDGVRGLAAVRSLGGSTLAQDEESSVVFGMAALAASAGSVDALVPLESLPAAVAGAASWRNVQ